MYKSIMSWAILSFLSVNLSAYAQTADSTTTTTTVNTTTAPAEVGTTTMDPGQYLVIDQGSGKKYSLMVTTKGSMILGPATAAAAPAAASSKAGGLQGFAESQMKQGVTNMVEKQGLNEIKGLIK
jgi:hypothetical protein